MKIAVNRACTTATVATIDDTNIDIVHKLYPTPVIHPGHPPRTQPSQPFCLLGHICQTIRHITPHKATGVNADSTDTFIDLVNANVPQVYDFNQIYTNNIPSTIKLGGVPQSSCPGFSESSGNTPHKVGEEKCEESKAKTANFGKD